MRIEQAVFTSAQTSRSRGYHLVAHSSGIDEELARQLALWAPSENCLIDRDVNAESLNVFRPEENWVAVSRTVYGGAEYSNRGQFRTETNLLLLQRAQFAGYNFDPLQLIRMARACGLLRLRPRLPQVLEPISLPSAMSSPLHEPPQDHFPELTETIIAHSAHERVVVVGCARPLSLLQQVLQRLPAEQRLGLSFSTGLKPSTHRPFQVQFIPAVNDELVRELQARGMRCLTA